jgi:hypothetical protein
MQKSLARQKKLPSSAAVDEMREDLTYKKKQLNDSFCCYYVREGFLFFVFLVVL